MRAGRRIGDASDELPLDLPAPTTDVVSVLLPYAVSEPYSYRVPHGMTLAPGDIVQVPLATREVIGAVWDDPPELDRTSNRLKHVTAKLDTPPLAADLRQFADWVAGYTLTTRGMVLRMILRSPAALEPERPRAGVAACRPGARTDDAGARARARLGRRRQCLGEVGPRGGGRCEFRASSTGSSPPARLSSSRSRRHRPRYRRTRSLPLRASTRPRRPPPMSCATRPAPALASR